MIQVFLYSMVGQRPLFIFSLQWRLRLTIKAQLDTRTRRFQGIGSETCISVHTRCLLPDE